MWVAFREHQASLVCLIYADCSKNKSGSMPAAGLADSQEHQEQVQLNYAGSISNEHLVDTAADGAADIQARMGPNPVRVSQPCMSILSDDASSTCSSSRCSSACGTPRRRSFRIPRISIEVRLTALWLVSTQAALLD